MYVCGLKLMFLLNLARNRLQFTIWLKHYEHIDKILNFLKLLPKRKTKQSRLEKNVHRNVVWDLSFLSKHINQ